MATNPNMVAIQTVTVGSGGAASIEFTNIPQTYTDLVVKVSARSTQTGNSNNCVIEFNGSGGTAYSSRFLYGDGSSAASASRSSQAKADIGFNSANSATANTFGNIEVYIPNYTSSNNKSFSADGVAETNATSVLSGLFAGLWSNSAAITSLKIFDFDSANLAQYSTATLYGVTSAQGSATGGFVTSDANYFYHTFLSSGTFTPLKSLSCDILVIAGGGGGGYETAGGGGAGGLAYYAGQSLTAQGYTVTVGGGGNGGTTGDGTNGSNSVFGSLTAATGGGGGGGVSPATAPSGGSGGGGKRGLNAGGAGTSGQGNAGGTGGPSSGTDQASGGGGGGAGAAGGNGATSSPYGAGSGGAGVNTYSSWATATSTGVSGYYAGGGGGGIYGGGGLGAPLYGAGAGGAGGGGAGGFTTNGAIAVSAGSPATANTGSGGGGGSLGNTAPNASAGGNGGSGIVIVRYAK